MGRACGTYEDEATHTVPWWGELAEGGHLKDLDVDGRNIICL